MDNQIDLIRIFVMTAESASFREAAGRLGISPQVVTRAIRQLEERVGETLFHRSTRNVRITTFGKAFALRANALLQSVDELFQANAARDEALSGTVRVTAPQVLGRRYVAPLLMQTMREHPNIVIDLRLSDTLSSPVGEQIDIGVRAGFITDGRYIARRVGALPIYTVAAPQLLDAAGTPDNIDALLEMPLTALIDRSTGRAWPWTFRHNRQLVPPQPTLVTDDPEAEVFGCVAGRGFSQCPEYMVRDELADGRLVRVLPRSDPGPWNLYVYRPQRGPVPKRVRVAFDALVKGLAATACVG
ncbi:LysR family transcriptional regulator [Trinickia fusca]|uniref:LysR family transcriptional regulator n=1 Tax=Trinickia fusca TaxID=2419777 RepID=A0A494XEP8_9BURK|nr:LysR family transcriptional regulator [Trinickia fusca]RKP46063.1 LysR family transcriptional regulator [Trinickia fusca]